MIHDTLKQAITEIKEELSQNHDKYRSTEDEILRLLGEMENLRRKLDTPRLH